MNEMREYSKIAINRLCNTLKAQFIELQTFLGNKHFDITNFDHRFKVR